MVARSAANNVLLLLQRTYVSEPILIARVIRVARDEMGYKQQRSQSVGLFHLSLPGSSTKSASQPHAWRRARSTFVRAHCYWGERGHNRGEGPGREPWATGRPLTLQPSAGSKTLGGTHSTSSACKRQRLTWADAAMRPQVLALQTLA